MNLPHARWFVAALAMGFLLAGPELVHAQTSTTSGATTSTAPASTTTAPASTTTTTGVSAPGGVPPVERLPSTARTTAPPVVARGLPARRLVDTGASTDRELTGAALLVCAGAALLVAGHVQRRRHRRIL